MLSVEPTEKGIELSILKLYLFLLNDDVIHYQTEYLTFLSFLSP